GTGLSRKRNAHSKWRGRARVDKRRRAKEPPCPNGCKSRWGCCGSPPGSACSARGYPSSAGSPTRSWSPSWPTGRSTLPTGSCTCSSSRCCCWDGLEWGWAWTGSWAARCGARHGRFSVLAKELHEARVHALPRLLVVEAVALLGLDEPLRRASPLLERALETLGVLERGAPVLLAVNEQDARSQLVCVTSRRSVAQRFGILAQHRPQVPA